ncbi:flavanone 3-dioxygenase 3-like [Nicotiana tabacum]|uniref:Flavanone 3-dioxygenase 3-like n=2 Tax=Nicotiana TaxID=4085 RepID=A0A1S3XVJ4_TOBAC|nr:PREDICTED: putative inactive flavonol synthase 2 [Nicotiana sylvestris]XP_016443895.1 PREDICTED: protein DMR6-LIKE OXYGENASE 1-like [Nicotiana tabacum]
MVGKMRDSSASPNGSFTTAMTLNEEGLTYVPKRYILPPSLRPERTLCDTCLPVVDLSFLRHPLLRPQIIQEVHLACKELGFFQVVNHGIPLSVMKDAIDAASEFFDLPTEEKKHLLSSNVHEPIRYGTSLNHVKDKVHFWRDFLKHYANPISTWIDLWPSNPTCYKEKMGNYTKAAQKLQEELMEVIFESLGLNPSYLHEDIAEGSQVMAVNCYPACPEPDLTLGLPPHTDYGMLSIILQNYQGLQIMDRDEKWHAVPVIEGALVVQLGDHMEVLSNGRYKSVLHRAAVNSEKKRISIASLHSLALGKTVRPAPDLVNEQHILSYKEGSFSDFLDFISQKNIIEGKYIDKLKINS